MPSAKQATKKAEKAGRALVIAIDFGTTNSGIAYGFTGNSDRPGQIRIEIVRRWPSVRSRTSDLQKVPTRLHYGPGGKISWGYEIPDNVNPLQWFKLLLMDKATIPNYLGGSTHLQEAQNMLDHIGKDATTVTADYLKLLWNHAITEIKRDKGASLVESTPFHAILTVPAVWPESARNRMQQAAERAGILETRLAGETSLKFISEPEAAAISILYSEFDDRPGVQKGTKFIVCDCGGGTVDIISYEIVEVQPELKIQECNIGSGGLCGSTFLDQAFQRTLTTLIKESVWNRYSKRKKRKTMDEWEYFLKPEFDGSDGQWRMDTATSRSLTFSKHELNEVFEPVVRQVTDLVEAQIKDIVAREHAAPEYLLLVGGFGQNKFLYKHLQKQLAVSKIEILQPQDSRSWTAIARGAALSKILQTSLLMPVTKRKARQSYGWVVEKAWDPNMHTEGQDTKSYDTLRGDYRALGQLDWLIVAGDDISSKVVPVAYNLVFSMERRGSIEYNSVLYKTARVDLPTRLDPADKTVQKVGEIELAFPMKAESLPVVGTGDEQRRELTFYQFGEIDGNSINIRAIYGNKTVGEMAVDYDNVEPQAADDDMLVG